jgi:hypothetical protein
MRKIEAFIQPFKLDEVKEALPCGRTPTSCACRITATALGDLMVEGAQIYGDGVNVAEAA